MIRNPHLGGVCGEIAVRDLRVYNFLEAAQHFEYKVGTCSAWVPAAHTVVQVVWWSHSCDA